MLRNANEAGLLDTRSSGREATKRSRQCRPQRTGGSAMSVMDPHSILAKGAEPEAPAAEGPQQGWPGTRPPGEAQGAVRFPGEDGGHSLAEMAQRDLAATLQLLAEQAQYITGSTGAAIALRDEAEMVCRASAGTSAPEVGAQLQVNSGLSGESIRTRQTLRCDDAATDPRVNRESCEALGIASVVVMPLVRGSDVIGVFELFSDKANIFEARDITALERMGAMVFSALDYAIAAHDLTSAPVTREAAPPATEADHEAGAGGDVTASASSAPTASGEITDASRTPNVPKMPPGVVFHPNVAAGVASSPAATTIPSNSEGGDSEKVEDEDILGEVPARMRESSVHETEIVEVAVADPGKPPAPVVDLATETVAIPMKEPENVEPTPASQAITEEIKTPPPSVVASLKKCEICGFPVSEGRQLCLDCERKRSKPVTSAAPSQPLVPSRTPARVATTQPVMKAPTLDRGPRFLGSELQETSWFASHKYMVGAIVLAVALVVTLLLIR